MEITNLNIDQTDNEKKEQKRLYDKNRNNQDHIKQKNREKNAEYRKNHPEKASFYARRWREKNPEKASESSRNSMRKYFLVPENRIKNSLRGAKKRALEKGLEFSISIEDLLPLPSICPVFGTALTYKGTGNNVRGGYIDNAPSIDRIDSSKGYVKGNVRIISWRANKLKSDASITELEQIISYMKENQVEFE